MTRDEIVAEAARRLGDSSAPFLIEVSAAFDFVLQDLAQHECISDLRKVASLDLVGLDQRDYPTRDLTGVVTPDFPIEILQLRVWGWNWGGIWERVNDTVFEAYRALEGNDSQGKGNRIWRVWPNEENVQIHPPGKDDAVGATIECLYIAPPTVLAGSAQITEVRREHLETIVHGLRARLAEVLEETAADAQTHWQLYIAGRNRMWGRRYNQGVGQMTLSDQ